MCRAFGLVLSFLVGMVITTAAVETVTIATADGPLTCYIFDSEYIPSTRIPIQGNGNGLFQIASSEPSFVGHGWGGPLQACVAGLSTAERCSFLRDHCRFELTLNGTRLVPTYMAVWPYEVEGYATWAVRWHYEFPAGFFSPGIHVLVGKWLLVDFPCSCDSSGCTDPIYAGGRWSVSDGLLDFAGSGTVLTLSVVFP
jgi:hypothetical protein